MSKIPVLTLEELYDLKPSSERDSSFEKLSGQVVRSKVVDDRVFFLLKTPIGLALTEVIVVISVCPTNGRGKLLQASLLEPGDQCTISVQLRPSTSHPEAEVLSLAIDL